MKIKTLIADDEFFIRKRLLKIISDNAPFVEIIGEAENGKDLLELIIKNDVDLVIMDIKMPELSGLEVAEYISGMGLNIKIIIISGYNDFEYARTALRFGVIEYLSKPIHLNQLVLALQKTKSSIEHSLNINRSNQTYTFLQVLQGRVAKTKYLELIKKKNEELNYQFVSGYFDAVDNDILHSLTRCIENFNLRLEYIREGDNVFTLFIYSDKNTLKNKEFIEQILNEFLSAYSNFYFVVFSEIFNKAANWREIYLHILNNLNYRFFYDKPTVTSYNEVKYSDLKSISDVRTQLTKLVKSKDFSGLQNYIYNFIDSSRLNLDINLLQNFIRELFSFLDVHFHILGNLSISEYIREFLDEDFRISDLKSNLHKLCMSYLEIGDTQADSDIILCNKVINLISDNYQNPEFGVGNIASELGLNVSYLGSIFKRVWNMSMLKYLSRVRLNKAKELLSSSDMKIADIALSCGYTDTFYFSKKYKAMFGYSPNKERLNKL